VTDVNRAPVAAPASAAPDHRRLLGRDPGQTELVTTGTAVTAKRPIAATESVIPELDETVAKPRPLWKHPAFIVSIALTLAALIAAGVFLVLWLLSDGPARIDGVELEVGEGNAHLTWTGTDEAVDLYVVNGGDVIDMSQLVRGGSEAWFPVGLPVGGGGFDDGSCFVVRPHANADAEVSLDAAALDEQGARSACVADAR